MKWERATSPEGPWEPVEKVPNRVRRLHKKGTQTHVIFANGHYYRLRYYRGY